MAQFFFDNIPLLQKDTGTQISMPATYNGQPARIRIGGQGYRLTSSLACNLSTTGLGGLDTGSLAANTLYYVYACVSSNTVGLVASAAAPTSGPTGFTQFRYLGKFKTLSGSAAVADLAIVNAIVGSGDELPAAHTTEWTSFTPTGSWTTNTVYTGRWRRVGSQIEIQCQISLSGAPGGTSQLGINLPNSYTLDTSSIAGTGRAGNLIEVAIYRNGIYGIGWGEYDATVSQTLKFRFMVQDPAGTTNTTSPLTATSPSTWANLDYVGVVARVPVIEFTGLFS